MTALYVNVCFFASIQTIQVKSLLQVLMMHSLTGSVEVQQWCWRLPKLGWLNMC